MRSQLGRVVRRFTLSLIISRFLSVFSVDVLVRASGLFLLPIYLRFMTKAEYGLYGYLSSIAASFALVLGLGLYVPQVKMYQDLKDERAKGIGLFTINLSLLGFLVLTLAAVYASGLDIAAVSLLFRHDIDYVRYRTYVLGTIFVTVFSVMLYSYLLTSENISTVKRYNVLRLIVLNGVVLLALSYTKMDTVAVRLKYPVLIEAGLIALFSHGLIKRMVPRFSIDVMNRSLKIGLPLMLASLVNTFYNLSDRFFLEKYYNLQVVGVYTLGLTLSSIIMTTMTSFQSIWTPLFYQEKVASVNLRRVQGLALWVFGAYTLLGLGIMVGTDLLLRYNVINSSYSEVRRILPILLLASIFSSVSQLFQNFMVYFEVTHICLSFHVIANVVCVVLCMLLVPRFGMYGASTALAMSAASSLGMHYVFVVNRTGLSARAA